MRSLFICLFLTSTAFASSNDFGETNELKKLSQGDFVERFELKGEVFVTSKDGTELLYPVHELRLWRTHGSAPILSNWSVQMKGRDSVHVQHEWKLLPGNRIEVRIEQFESMSSKMPVSSDVILGKRIKSEKFILKDFAPVSFVPTTPNDRIVMRLTPLLQDSKDLIDIKDVPIRLDQAIILDQDLHVWAKVGSMEGKYLHLKTHRGSVALSPYMFKGAKEIGYIQGNRMVIRDGKTELEVVNSAPFLSTSNRVRLYGFINTKNRSEHPRSLYSGSSDDEVRFLQGVK